MNPVKILQITGTVLSVAATVISAIAGTKQMDAKIAEKVAEAVTAQK